MDIPRQGKVSIDWKNMRKIKTEIDKDGVVSEEIEEPEDPRGYKAIAKKRAERLGI